MKHNKTENSKIEKLCVLTPNKRFLGANLVMVPFFMNLRKIFPNARITAVSPKPQINMIKELGFIDEVIMNDITGVGSFFSVLKHLRKQRYDVLFTIRRKAERDWLLNIFSRAKLKVGFKRKWSPLVYKYYFKYDKNTYRGTNFLKLLKPFYGEKIEYVPVLPDYECRTDPAVWLIPCSLETERQWPVESYIQLARRVLLELEHKVIFVLGKEEKKYLPEINSGLSPYLDRIGVLNDRAVAMELLGESNNCVIAVSNNCGPGHVPQITGRKCCVLFHYGTNVYEWINREGAASEIVAKEASISSITVEKVFNILKSKMYNEAGNK